jgi:hypothetical protein
MSRRSLATLLVALLAFALLLPAAASAAHRAPPRARGRLNGPAASPNDATVAGVVSGSDGVPIPGAAVAVSFLSQGVFAPVATLNDDGAGRWAYTDKEGTYRFDFSAPSADPANSQLVTLRRSAYTLDVTLTSYGALDGAITAASDGAPLPGATVELYRRSLDGSWPAVPAVALTTAADGTYASGALLAGSYAVKASAPDYEAAFFGGPTIDAATPVLVVRAGSEAAPIALPLDPPPTGAIQGVVVSGAGRVPQANAYVWLYLQNADGTWPPTSPGWGTPTRTVYTAADGTYDSGPLPLGNYKVRFFTVHAGSQWWQYVTTVDSATVVTLSTDGEVLTGIEGWLGKP